MARQERVDASAAGGSRSPSTYAIRSVERVVDVIELLVTSNEPASLQEVAEVTGLPRSSAFRYLATLESRGYAVREPGGTGYVLGPEFPRPSDHRPEVLADAAGPFLHELAEETGETTNLGVLSGTRIAYLEIVESHRQVRLAAKVGDRDPLHATALGKAIASLLPESEVLHILRVEGMPALTDRTITTPKAYLEELAAVRANGYALDNCENEADGRCIAVPVRDVSLYAAISLSAPASRMSLDAAAELVEPLERVTALVADEFRHRTGTL